MVGGVAAQAVTGQLAGDLLRAEPARWSNLRLQIKLDSGDLQSRSRLDVLNGANAAAIGMDGVWEVIQFEKAELVAPLTYELSGILRGQAGTDGIMPEIWPAGAEFVLMNGAPKQIDVPIDHRDLDRHYRVGPANLAYDNPRYAHFEASFAGVGLRPYAVSHLRVSGNADLTIRWIRRTRLDGDSWSGPEVPLSEENETYDVRVIKAGAILREVTVSSPVWTYAAAQKTSDGAVAPFEIHVAQVSSSYGVGPFQRIEIND